VVPHEPTRPRVESVLGELRGAGLRAVTLATVERSASVGHVDAVVVERVGVLAHLYTAADVAFVGGAYGRTGVHSVLEPAAAGAPPVFGPGHGNARAAQALLAVGAAHEAVDAGALGSVLLDWLHDAVAKEDATERCLDYIGAHLGAAARTAALLDPLIGQADRA